MTGKALTDGDVSLLLLPSDESAPAQRTHLGLGLELPQMELDAGLFKRPEVSDLTSDRAGTSCLPMVSNGREVHDGANGAATRQSMEVRAAERVNVETTERTLDRTLRIESGVVQVQAVDKEGAAVDGCLQKRKNPGVATPGGPRDIPVGK